MAGMMAEYGGQKRVSIQYIRCVERPIFGSGINKKNCCGCVDTTAVASCNSCGGFIRLSTGKMIRL